MDPLRDKRVSVSVLDQYRRFTAGDCTIDDLIKSVLRVNKPTPAMLAGREVHYLIELHGDPGREVFEFINPARCTAAFCAADYTGESELPISDDLEGWRIGARADLINGLEIREFKTTSYAFDPQRYIDAFQWRFYLVLTGCERFVYRVFEMKKERKTGLFFIGAHHTLPLYRYPDIERDCADLVLRFAAWRDFTASAGELAAVTAADPN